MKKTLLFLLLATTINLSAQSTTYFAKALELNAVPASYTKSDSVLVRGADKIIKYVPRSEFTSKGVNFQSAVDNGNTYTDGVNTITVYPNVVEAKSNDGNEGSYMNTFSFTTGNYTGSTGASLTNNGQLRLNTIGKAQTFLQESNSTLVPRLQKLPDADGTLAISVNRNLADVNGNVDVKFNSIFDNGNNVYTNADSSAIFQIGLSGTSASDNFGYHSHDPLTGGVSLSAGKSGGGFSFRNGDYSNQIRFSLDNVNSDIRLEVIKNFNSTSLRFEEPLNAENAVIFIPAKKTGNYVVALTSDIAVSNSTTVSLSAADLNAAYPNSVTGKKIQCLDISAGGKIYEKTNNGWVVYPVTALP